MEQAGVLQADPGSLACFCGRKRRLCVACHGLAGGPPRSSGFSEAPCCLTLARTVTSAVQGWLSDGVPHPRTWGAGWRAEDKSQTEKLHTSLSPRS